MAARTLIEVEAPATGGKYLATGTVELAPGVVTDLKQFRIVSPSDEPGGQVVPFAVLSEVRWPDGSLMAVQLAFPVTAKDVAERRYWLESAGSGPPEQYTGPRDLPVLRFRLSESSEPVRVHLDMDVGQLMVRVDQHPELYYYWYLIPIACILGLLIWRKVHLQ